MNSSSAVNPPNDDNRSEEQIKADNDNHSNQLNPNNDEHWNSRGDDYADDE